MYLKKRFTTGGHALNARSAVAGMTTVQTFHFTPFRNDDDDFIIEGNIIIIATTTTKNNVDCGTLNMEKSSVTKIYGSFFFSFEANLNQSHKHRIQVSFHFISFHCFATDGQKQIKARDAQKQGHQMTKIRPRFSKTLKRSHIFFFSALKRM